MKKVEIKEIAIKEIIFDEFQPRQIIEKRELEDLAKDIKQRGLLYPILVMLKKGKYFILDGERRVRACQLNGYKTISARVLDVKMLEAYEIQMVANFKRANVQIQETAKAVERFKEEFLNKYPKLDPIARLVELSGFSRIYFESAEAINRTDGEFKEKVFTREIGGYAASEIEKATKDEELREGLREGYLAAIHKGRKLGANASRPLKKQLEDIEEDGYIDEEKREIAKGLMLKTYGLLDDQLGNSTKGNYLVYLATIRNWQRDIEEWHLVNFGEKQLKSLANELNNLLALFNNKRRVLFGELSANPMYHSPRDIVNKKKVKKLEHLVD